MKISKLDVSPWNLGLPLVLLAACGRTLPLLPAGDTEGDDTTIGDPTEPTDPTVNPTTPGECQDSGDCPEGYYCSYSNVCVSNYNDDDYCSDDGCCWDGCCYYGCYYDCYNDDDCGSGYQCLNYSCEPVTGPSVCPDIPVTFIDAQPIHESMGGVSLAFVDTPAPGRELVIAGAERVVVRGAQGEVELAAIEGLSVDVADLDADGDEDIVVVSPTGLHAFLFDGMNFVTGPVTPIDEVSAARLTLADFNGDGSAEAFVAQAQGVAQLAGMGDGSFGVPFIVAGPSCGIVAVTSPNFEATDDLAFGEAGQARYAAGGPMADFVAYDLGGPRGLGFGCPLGAGDFDADGLADAALLDASGGGGVTIWRAVAALDGSSQWYPPLSHTLANVADLDADGYADLILAGATTDITIRFGTQPSNLEPLGCYAHVSLGVTPQTLAVGDLDGNGRADLVGADGSVVWVWYANN